MVKTTIFEKIPTIEFPHPWKDMYADIEIDLEALHGGLDRVLQMAQWTSVWIVIRDRSSITLRETGSTAAARLRLDEDQTVNALVKVWGLKGMKKVNVEGEWRLMREALRCVLKDGVAFNVDELKVRCFSWCDEEACDVILKTFPKLSRVNM